METKTYRQWLDEQDARLSQYGIGKTERFQNALRDMMGLPWKNYRPAQYTYRGFPWLYRREVVCDIMLTDMCVLKGQWMTVHGRVRFQRAPTLGGECYITGMFASQRRTRWAQVSTGTHPWG